MSALPVLHGSAAESFAYYGDREGWLIALSQHRDSDALGRSNWRVIVPPMLADHPEDAAVESMNHWAVGWIEYLLVRPGTKAAAKAEEWVDKLDSYPVADEMDWGELEWMEEWCVRCDRGTREQHTGEGWDRFRSKDDASEIADRWRYRR
jgi:hypothetical protein